MAIGPGSRLGPYEVATLIGEDGMSDGGDALNEPDKAIQRPPPHGDHCGRFIDVPLFFAAAIGVGAIHAGAVVPLHRGMGRSAWNANSTRDHRTR